MDDELELIDYIRVLYRRRVSISIGIAVSLIISIIHCYTTVPVYEASARILITQPKIKVSLESRIQTDIASSSSIATLLELVKNRELEKVLVQKLKNKYPELTVPEVDGKVEVELVPGTNMIEIIIKDSIPERAADIANHWAETFIERNNELYSSNTKTALDFVESQLNNIKGKLKQIEEKIKTFNESSKITLIYGKIISIEGGLIEDGRTKDNKKLDKKMSVVEGTLVKNENRLSSIRTTLKKYNAEISTRKKLLKNQINKIEKKKHLNFIEENIIKQEVLIAEANQIKKEIEIQNKNLMDLRKKLEEKLFVRNELDRERSTTLETYGILNKKFQELKISLYASDTGAIVVAEKAYIPTSRISPNNKKIISFGVLFGTLCMVFISLFLEYVDRALKKRREQYRQSVTK